MAPDTADHDGESPVPAWARPEIGSVLIGERRLKARVASLAAELRAEYGPLNPLLAGVLNGSLMFLADLARALDMPLEITLLQASSYRKETRPGELSIGAVETDKIAGRHVLLVDDILDTGLTLAALQKAVLHAGPASLKTCVLLEKPARQARPAKSEFVGFRIADEFVVGYGLDFAGRYRQLPFIATLGPGA